jgi:hypothetical protein
MLCFKVEINNDSVCLAGVGHSGVLTAVLSWVADHQQALAPEERPPVVLRVGGLSGGGKTAQFVDWTNRDLNTGDEIRITIIDAIECDSRQRQVFGVISPTEQPVPFALKKDPKSKKW